MGESKKKKGEGAKKAVLKTLHGERDNGREDGDGHVGFGLVGEGGKNDEGHP